MKGNNKVQGVRLYGNGGRRAVEEIRLRVPKDPVAKAQPDDSPAASIQAKLQGKVDKGSLTIHIHESDPYNDINPTGDYTLRRDDRKGTTEAYDPRGSWLGEGLRRPVGSH